MTLNTSSAGAQPAHRTTASGRIYFLDAGGGRVFSANPDGSDLQTIVSEGRKFPDGLTVDAAAGQLYWTNMNDRKANDGSILRSDLDGRNMMTIVPPGGTFTPKQLQLDTQNRKLYWSDREGMRVMRANLDGSRIETLVDTGRGDPRPGPDPRKWCVGVAVDAQGGKIYWSQKGGDNACEGSILRANLEIPAGQTPANRNDIELLYSDLPEPIDLDLDLTNRLMYWTDRGDPPRGNTVNCAPMDPSPGRQPDILFSHLMEGIGLALDLKGRRMFVTDLAGSVYSADLDGANFKVLLDHQGNLTGIAYAENLTSDRTRTNMSNNMPIRDARPRHIPDLREYVKELAIIGELIEIEREVDWKLEIGAITRRSYELGAPAPLFTKVKNAGANFRVLGAPAGLSSIPGQRMARVALSVGLPAGAQPLDIVEALSHAEDYAPEAPRRLKTAPCKENIQIGEEVDLMQLPTPLIHSGDGGRYLNTWGTIVARTPDGTWTNWSIARIMLRDSNTMVGIVSPQKHVGRVHAMWKEIGQPMPFALSLGQDPVIPFFAGMPLRDGVSEGPVIGGYLGNPIDVVGCETVDLEVPASSEIVIEGHLTLDEMDEEGPMAEYPGYLVPGSRRMRPVYRVSAMTYRNNAILPIVAAGYPPEENHTCWGIGIAATVLAELRRARWPVTSVFVPFEAACHLLVVTVPSNWRDNSEYRSTQDFTRALGAFVFATCGGTVVPRVLVVLDDIDPSKPHEVLWAMATRVHPGDGEIPFPAITANPLNAFMKAGEKAAMLTNKAVIDGLPRDDWRPDQVPVRADFATLYPAALKRSITELWSKDYGFPPAPVR